MDAARKGMKARSGRLQGLPCRPPLCDVPHARFPAKIVRKFCILLTHCHSSSSSFGPLQTTPYYGETSLLLLLGEGRDEGAYTHSRHRPTPSFLSIAAFSIEYPCRPNDVLRITSATQCYTLLHLCYTMLHFATLCYTPATPNRRPIFVVTPASTNTSDFTPYLTMLHSRFHPPLPHRLLRRKFL